jgi:hypothetical protein
MSASYYIIVDSKDRTLNEEGRFYQEQEFGYTMSGCNHSAWRAWHYSTAKEAMTKAAEFAELTGESYLILTTHRRVVVQKTIQTQDFT